MIVKLNSSYAFLMSFRWTCREVIFLQKAYCRSVGGSWHEARTSQLGLLSFARLSPPWCVRSSLLVAAFSQFKFDRHSRWLTSPAALTRQHHIALRHLHHNLRNPTSAVQTLSDQHPSYCAVTHSSCEHYKGPALFRLASVCQSSGERPGSRASSSSASYSATLAERS